jgi:DDE family transposase
MNCQGIAMDSTTLNEDWEVLLSMFPENWRELAKDTHAMVRKLRSFPDEESILRTLFLHLANGYSLRETITRAKLAGIADVSDVALLKRLQCSELWLKELSLCLLRERGTLCNTPSEIKSIQMRLVDGTYVKEPGKTGSQWRIHYSMKLPDLQCDYFKLTENEGVQTGESYKQFPVKKGDCIIGDRAYSTAQGIEYLDKKGAYSLVRVNTSSLILHSSAYEIFDLLEAVSDLKEEHSIGQWKVMVSADYKNFVSGRVCVIRKSNIAAQQAIKTLKEKASKKQKMIKPATLEFAKYIIVFTTLPDNFSPKVVLEWYRVRWQIELVFKRLKSLTGFGHLPKHDERSSRAWLYGKLLVGLLVEKLIHCSSVISPWGYYL